MSQPNWKKPLGLAVTLVVLGSVVYWSEFNRRPKKEEAEEQEKNVTQLKDKSIKSIFISDGQQKEIEFDCMDAGGLCKTATPSKWQLGSPIKLKADDANVNSFVNSITSLTASDTISLKEETPEKKAALLKEYGLDPALITSHKDRELLITTSEGTVGVYLGVQHPIGEGIFAAAEKVGPGQKLSGKIDDNLVYVLPNYLKGNFEKDLLYWRDKKLFSISSAEVGTFHLKTPKVDVTAQKTSGTWTLTSSEGEMAGDTESIDNLLTGATYLVAKGIVSEHKTDAAAQAALKGAKPIVTFTLERAKSPTPAPSGAAADQPITLVLFQKPDGKPEKNGALHMKTFATVSASDPVYEVESYAKERLDKELKDLRLSKLITSMDRFSSKKLLVEGGSLEKPISLSMKDAKWTDSANPQGGVDSEKVQTLLDKLSSSHIKEFVPLKKAPADAVKSQSGALKLTLGDEADPTKRRLAFWKTTDKAGMKLYARDLNSKRDEVFVVDSALDPALPWKSDPFAKTK